MILRPYQETAVDQCATALAEHRSVLLQLPTGGGKTAIAAEIFRRAVASNPGKRFAFLAHRDDLLGDTQARLAQAGIWAGRIQAGSTPDPLAIVHVCSVQTLYARTTDLSEFAGIIVDEAHRAPSASIMAILAGCPDAWILGLSATPQRGDGTALDPPFRHMVRGPSVRDLIGMGYLVPCEVYGPPMRQDLPAMALHDAVKKYHQDSGKTLVFCRDVATARALAEEIGPLAACVDGSTEFHDRHVLFEKFRERGSGVDILTNCMVLTEGFDAPITDTLILGRGCTHASAYLQIVGRAMRSYPGKRVSTIVDLCGVSTVHGLPDDDREYCLSGKPIRRIEREPIKVCPKCFAVHSPAPRCPRCGTIYPPPPPKKEVKTAEMKRSDGINPLLAEQRKNYKASLIAVQKARGYAYGWVIHRLRARYGFAF